MRSVCWKGEEQSPSLLVPPPAASLTAYPGMEAPTCQRLRTLIGRASSSAPVQLCPPFPSLFEKDVSSLLLLCAVGHTQSRLHPSGHACPGWRCTACHPKLRPVQRATRPTHAKPPAPSSLSRLNMFERQAGKRGALLGRPHEHCSSQDRLEGAETETGSQL